jgi:hypothetical protein
VVARVSVAKGCVTTGSRERPSEGAKPGVVASGRVPFRPSLGIAEKDELVVKLSVVLVEIEVLETLKVSSGLGVNVVRPNSGFGVKERVVISSVEVVVADSVLDSVVAVADCVSEGVAAVVVSSMGTNTRDDLLGVGNTGATDSVVPFSGSRRRPSGRGGMLESVVKIGRGVPLESVMLSSSDLWTR